MSELLFSLTKEMSANLWGELTQGGELLCRPVSATEQMEEGAKPT